MNLTFISEVWDSLNYYIDSNERNSAASTLVDLLVDNNYDADEIKSAFAGDKAILKALEAYDQEFDDYDDDEDDYDEDEW